MVSSIAPGLFIIGYIIGTGSVTSMAKSGADYGMSLFWALALSCFCTYVLVVAISRVTIVSGHTIVYCIRRRFGSALAILIIVGLMATVVTSVMGVMGIAADVAREWSGQLLGREVPPLASAIFFNALLLFLFWSGSHRLFLKAMSVIVAMMSLSFIGAAVMVTSSPGELLVSLKPAWPAGGDAHLVLAAMVGTTMASVCVVTRSYLVAEHGWTVKDLAAENRDAIISLSLTLLVSGAIMACATGTMRSAGITVEQAIDMVKTLEPLAGPYATGVFVIGIVAAALSSLFPNYLLGPWVVCDYRNVQRDMQRPVVRLAVAAVASLAFVVPIFGGRPVLIMIVSQAISPVIMPLLIVFMLILLNDKTLNSEYKTPIALNVGLLIALSFSLLASYSAVLGLIATVRGM